MLTPKLDGSKYLLAIMMSGSYIKWVSQVKIFMSALDFFLAYMIIIMIVIVFCFCVCVCGYKILVDEF